MKISSKWHRKEYCKVFKIVVSIGIGFFLISAILSFGYKPNPDTLLEDISLLCLIYGIMSFLIGATLVIVDIHEKEIAEKHQTS